MANSNPFDNLLLEIIRLILISVFFILEYLIKESRLLPLPEIKIEILRYLRKNKIDLICLAGYMKILSSDFIRKFKNPILNIHPSLLPKYKGLNTHRRAIKNKDKFSGATVHLVTHKLDSGKTILQKKVRISKSDTEQTLAKKVLKIEHKLYPAAIEKFLKKTSPWRKSLIQF